MAHTHGERLNVDNMAKRQIVPALSRCAVCKKAESEKHADHTFESDGANPAPAWVVFAHAFPRYAGPRAGG